MQRIVAAAVFAIAFVVYAMTLAPTVGLVDSGALTIAAWSLGNAHPPGFPLYLILTKLAMLLPIGNVAFRANLASAFFAALACAMVSLAVREALLHRKTKKDPEVHPSVIAVAMAFSGLLLAFGRTLWGYATVAEVYALNTFLIATIVWLMLAWRRTGDVRRLYVAALIFGLALGVHHLTVALTLLGIAVLVFRTGITKKQFAIAFVIATVAFLAIYAYLPIAASRDPVMNWGNPDNVQRFVNHVTAKQYRVYVRAEESQVDDIVRLVTREFGPRAFPIALLVGVFGLWLALRRDASLFWLLVLMIAGCMAWMSVYPIVNDEDAYLLPAFVALAIAAGFAIRSKAAAIALVLPIIAVVSHWSLRDRSEFFVAKDYVDNTFRGLEQNALLITNDWQLWAPMFYYQNAEGMRPDVISIEYGMLIRSWYVEQLAERYPELFAAVEPELDAYRPLMHINENDPARWADVAVQTAYNARLDDLVFALIGAQLARGGHAYATFDVAMSREPVDQNLVRRIAQFYDVVPRGIALELLPGHQRRDVTLTPLELRSMRSGKYEADDVVMTEVLPAYRNVALIRARYLALTGKHDAALAAYQEASELDPGNGLIVREIQAVQMRKSATP